VAALVVPAAAQTKALANPAGIFRPGFALRRIKKAALAGRLSFSSD
jgi:hypothetical protein